MIAGRYTLDREIGRGGTGPVWLAMDEVLQRRVAMKRIGMLPGVDEFDRARAEREARLSAHLHHPHVVQVYDVAVAEDGITHWLVMEYVDGPSLGAWIKEHGPMDPELARPVLLQVARALLAAHEADIVHRDVKPSNVLLDSSGTAKLTDFGIARVTNDPVLTQTGLLTGSPAYLAPEVAEGGTGDQLSDVWALGATAFHMLSGRPPYEVDGNVLGTLYRIVNDEPPRLADAGSLSDFLLGTMTKDPEQRWTMSQVVDALQGAKVAAPVFVAPISNDDGQHTRTIRRATPEKKRFPFAWLAILVGLVLIAGLGVVLVQALGREGDPPAAGAQPNASSTPAGSGATAAGMEQFVRDYVARIGDDPVTAWPMLTAAFQIKSGGFENYAKFWKGARDGEISNLSADPHTMVVNYDVKWKGHANGPRTRLLLVLEDGRYLIDDEITKGFEPTG